MSKKILDNLGVSAFCESMATMMLAGIPTDEAVALLHSESGTEGLLAHGLGIMKEKTEAGESLAKAMKASGIFPRYALQMVEAGEDSGRQEDILFSLSRYYSDQKTMADKIRSAVTYPAAMLIMIIAVLAILISMVLPAFRDVYNKLTGSLASSSYGYVRWAYVLCWVALAILAVIAIVMIIGMILWKTGKRSGVEKVLRIIPGCSSLLENMGLFRFTSALSTFLASGELQDNAVSKSIPMTDCAPVEKKLQRCLERMEEGHGFAQAAHEENLFEPVYGRMLLAGERSGKQEEVLQRISELLKQDCSDRVDRLVGTVDPILSGILMITVGLSLLSVMLPLIGMMNSVA